MRKFWLTMGAVCLLALLLAASALAQPSLEDARKAVVFVEFVFEDDSMQPAMGLVVGPPGKPSKYVLTDNWAMTDDTGENTASTAWVLSVDKFEPYEVVKAYVQPFTRLILLETETEIEGSEALRFADPTDFGVGSRVYPVALTWETEDADWTLCQGEIESIQSVGQTYDELMADVRL